MKYFILAFYLVLTVACGEAPRWQKGLDTHDRSHSVIFNNHIAALEAHFNYDSTTTIRFNRDDENMGHGVLGRCFRDYKMVVIQLTEWNKLNKDSKRILIAHELGHCDFNKDHAPDYKNIMHEYYNSGIFRAYIKDPIMSLNDILLAPDYK